MHEHNISYLWKQVLMNMLTVQLNLSWLFENVDYYVSFTAIS